MATTKYSDAEKARICADWALIGDDDLVSSKHGVKKATLQHWKRQAWWRDMLDTMHSQHTDRLVAKANRAMDHALDELQDRIERGDMRCTLKNTKGEDGETVQEVVSYREPVKARDLSAIVNVLATRSEKAAQLSTQKTTSYQLQDLRDSFRQFATSYRAKQVIDTSPQTIEHTSIVNTTVQDDEQGNEHRAGNGSGEG